MLYNHYGVIKWSYEQVAWNIDGDIKAREECTCIDKRISEEIRIINYL